MSKIGNSVSLPISPLYKHINPRLANRTSAAYLFLCAEIHNPENAHCFLLCSYRHGDPQPWKWTLLPVCALGHSEIHNPENVHCYPHCPCVQNNILENVSPPIAFRLEKPFQCPKNALLHCINVLFVQWDQKRTWKCALLQILLRCAEILILKNAHFYTLLLCMARKIKNSEKMCIRRTLLFSRG